MHPILLPGTHLVRRGPDQLQAGLHRGRSVALDPPADGPAAQRTLRRAGLLLDDDRPLRAALPPADSVEDPWVRHTLSASARRTAGCSEPAFAHRGRLVVQVATFGHPVGLGLAEDLATLCRRVGLRLPGPGRPGPVRRGAVPPQPLAVLLGVGEPARDLLDPWIREGVPHLVVRLVEGDAVVGPFVDPGRTSCLRCIDAYLTEQDPAWPLLVEQYSRATRTDRPDGIPEPVDAALAAVAVGWAVRDLQAYAESAAPASWSSTVTLSADLTEITPQHWPTHPHCGCAWS